MIAPHRDDERFVEQVFARDARADRQAALDDEIEIARRELALDVADRHAPAHEPQARRFLRERGDEPRQRDRFEHVAQAHDDAQVECRRVERRLRARRVLQSFQVALDIGDDCAGALGRHDAVALADEQRIVELGAQAIERVRDRGLRQVQRAGRGADPAMHVDGVEHAEQVEVEAEIDGHGTREWWIAEVDSNGCASWRRAACGRSTRSAWTRRTKKSRPAAGRRNGARPHEGRAGTQARYP